jgi:hypothetical protein
MAEMNMPEQKQPVVAADDDDEQEEDEPTCPEMTDRRGALIVLGVMLLPPLILTLVEFLRPAN